MTDSPTLPTVALHVLDADTLQALVDRDLERARAASGLPVPEDWAKDVWLWTYRLGQLIGEPAVAPWLVRAIVAADGAVVGHAGYHGPPDERGMVEIGYRLIPEARGNGYARAAVQVLLDDARTLPGDARIARASVRPDNEPSLRIVRQFGFVQVGEQVDERDGLELVFERDL